MAKTLRTSAESSTINTRITRLLLRKSRISGDEQEQIGPSQTQTHLNLGHRGQVNTFTHLGRTDVKHIFRAGNPREHIAAYDVGDFSQRVVLKTFGGDVLLTQHVGGDDGKKSAADPYQKLSREGSIEIHAHRCLDLGIQLLLVDLGRGKQKTQLLERQGGRLK